MKDIRAKDRGAVSHKDLIRREITYEESLLQIKSAEEQLKSARLNLGYTKVYASVDGFVSNLDIRDGTQAVANQPLVALIDKTASGSLASSVKTNWLKLLRVAMRA